MYSHQSLAEKRLLNPRSRPEGSYKIGSVCSSFHPSFRLSVHFLGIGSLVFPVRSPYIVVCDISHLWKWAILGPKIAHPLNSGSAGRSFFKFCKMKWANRQMRMVIIIFSKKKIVWDKWTIFGRKMAHRHNSGSAVRSFLNFTQRKGLIGR